MAMMKLYPTLPKKFSRKLNNFNFENNLKEKPYNDEWQVKDIEHSKEDIKVYCTYCIHTSAPAVKSCLLCEASLCDAHLQVHSKSKEHVLIAPMETFGKTEDAKCSVHDEALKYYCLEDATFICTSCCVAGIHKRHQVEPLAEASERKKKDFENILEKSIIQEREIELRVQELQNKREVLKVKANNLSVRVSDQFRDIRYQMDVLELRILNDIAKEEIKLSEPISLLIEKLEQQKDELSRNMELIEELCNLTDPLTILRKASENRANFCYPKSRPSLLCEPDDLDEGLILVSLQKSLDDIMARIKRWHWASDVTLDANTAANDIYVSGDTRTVSWSKISQRRPKTLEQFKNHQVMSIQKFSSGRHYWEVDTNPSGKWIVGVCYPSIDRKGELSFIGNNDKSWGLCYADNKYKAMYDRTERHLPSLLPSNKIGVYLDYEAGQLSFYEVSEDIKHIHTFTATFTEPVHAIFWVWYSWMRINS